MDDWEREEQVSGDEGFDRLAKSLAGPTTRRRALKLLGASAVGSVLSLSWVGRAAGIGRCRRVGQPCRQHAECCDFFCPPETGRCACFPGQQVCPRTRRCIFCPEPCTLDPDTCECTCPPCPADCAGECGISCQSPDCLCGQTVEGTCECFTPACIGPECTASADCPDGFGCVATCCGVPVCAPLCGTLGVTATSAQRAWAR